MKVALFQLSPKRGDKAANLKRMEKAVGREKPDLAMFGELFLSGYMARDAHRKLAETVPGPSTKAIAKLAAKTGSHVLVGLPERDAETKTLYNSAVLVAPDGETFCYRKIHPANFGPFEEGLYFARGSEPVLARTDLGAIGLMICFDCFFPELGKAYALDGADMIAAISAAPSTSKPFFDRILPARAIENTLFVLYANLVGTELNVVFQGGTQAIGPRGEYLGRAKDFEEDVVTANVDLRDLRAARHHRPTIRDTRLELFERGSELPPRRRGTRHRDRSPGDGPSQEA